jgi:hypothetical protein
VIASGFGRNNSGLAGVAVRVVQAFSTTPQRGALTSIYLASSPQVAGVSGVYFSNRRPAKAPAAANDAAIRQRLWRISAEQTGLTERS